MELRPFEIDAHERIGQRAAETFKSGVCLDTLKNPIHRQIVCGS
jgi:hypothetical protein